MNVDEFYEQITKNKTPEQALKNIISHNIIKYSNLKFNNDNIEIHPIVLINIACNNLGWDVYLSYDDSNNLYGLFTGTEKYINNVIGFDNFFDDETFDDDNI